MNVRERNKKRLAVISALLALIIGAVIITGGISVSTGRFIKTDGDTALIVTGNSPVVMINETGSKAPFEDYSTGDSLLIIHGDVAESYPASTQVYHCICLNGGTADDIPQGVLTALQEMNWNIITE